MIKMYLVDLMYFGEFITVPVAINFLLGGVVGDMTPPCSLCHLPGHSDMQVWTAQLSMLVLLVSLPTHALSPLSPVLWDDLPTCPFKHTLDGPDGWLSS